MSMYYFKDFVSWPYDRRDIILKIMVVLIPESFESSKVEQQILVKQPSEFHSFNGLVCQNASFVNRNAWIGVASKPL